MRHHDFYAIAGRRLSRGKLADYNSTKEREMGTKAWSTAVKWWYLWILVVFCLSGCKVPLESQLYVTVAGNSEVVVIDERQAEVVAHITVGAGPAIAIATPDNGKVYTANWGDNTVSAIDTRTHSVTNIALPSRPYIIAMSPDGKYVYAGLYANQIDVIDTGTDSVERSIPVDALPASLFVGPDGEILYVATTATSPGRIWAISAESGDVIHPAIDVGLAPGWITMSPDGDRIYALNFYSDDISVVDTALWVVADTIDTGVGSRGIIGNVTPDNRLLYVTNLGTAEVIAIDTQSHEIVSTVPVDGRPSGVHFNHNATKIYVTDYGPESLNHPPNSTFLYTGVWDGIDPGYVNVIKAGNGEILSRVAVGPGATSVVGISRFERRNRAR